MIYDESDKKVRHCPVMGQEKQISRLPRLHEEGLCQESVLRLMWLEAYRALDFVITQRQARELGLTGYAYNMDDGRVEVVAEGESDVVQQLVDWLKQGGPRGARVDQVLLEPRPLAHFTQFKIKY